MIYNDFFQYLKTLVYTLHSQMAVSWTWIKIYKVLTTYLIKNISFT